MNFPIPTIEQIQSKLQLSEAPEHIGTGGFKAVYKIKNEAGQFEALKAVHIPAIRTGEESLFRNQLIARAKREIAALAECSFPSIVKLGTFKAQMLTIGSSDYLTYSEELLPGTSLVEWLIQKHTATLEELKALMLMLTKLIDSLAKLNYIHRDIKPENIMYTGNQDRPFVILDMGIAYKMQGTDLTQGPRGPGTTRYMAPELFNPNYKDALDYRCDLYSAGLTTYVLASQTHPFAPAPEMEYATMYRIMNVRPQPLSFYRPDLPPQFCQIIDRCIRKKPALRYNNLEALQEELRKVTL